MLSTRCVKGLNASTVKMNTNESTILTDFKPLDYLLSLGVDHNTVDLYRIGSLLKIVDKAYKEFFSLSSGVVVLATCNRFEVYIDKPVSKKELINKFSELTGLTPSVFEGVKAVEHLFRVASGIESRVIGENEIMGQVRDAWKLARENSFSSNLLDSVFMYAIKVGRRAREETGISRGVIGYPKAGIIASRRVLGDFKGKNVLILGAGKAGRIITEEICKLFPKNIIVANRSLFKASELLRICPLVKPVGLLDIPPQKYDVAFIALTDKPEKFVIDFVLKYSHLVVDISIPPVVSGDSVIDVSFLDDIIEEGSNERKKWVPVIESIIDEEISKLTSTLRSRDADAVVSAVNYAIESIVSEEMNWINGKIPQAYREYVKLALRASLKKMAHPLILSLRELARSGDTKALDIFLEKYSKF
jgi:glutamyl-tRNA reductase